jgi:hypothetical protein
MTSWRICGSARDMLQALLKESNSEEAMMRDYVMGVGYR